ncbi:phosphotransferase [Streptomyces guryensis]|uniref:Aminoglycoside phosphotransferase family protein n=1 Tax=Streptomyces guryensis TaxID=2886947 RepID=A0A9Q3VPX3_9ACTN|nr:aminoglycoside phosphotransferase family protein [Streptomyces guryensis]MCD9874910.1 aminoglycoside phosphotransferase family protein [Streptomyces guryensis]
MSSSPQRWARAERLDAARMVDALHAQTGVRLTLDGACSGGQVGAAYVRWADGRRSVLKWRPHSRAEEMRAGPLAVTEALRRAGYPAPATELVTQVGHAVVIVQELLPGRKIDRFDHRSLDQVLQLNELQTGRLSERPDIPAVDLHLQDDGAGYCLHGPLREHNRRSAALERWIATVGAESPPPLTEADAVHFDFHPGNLLADGGAITGVVDWDGAARGDRRFDLVTLRFGLHAQESGPGVAQRLDAVLDSLPEDILRPTWAHLSLRMVDWAIRHFTPSDVEHWLDLAEQRVS